MTGTVVVVGSLNTDLIVRVPRLPGPGETVTGGAYRRAPGGKGANAAAAAAALGATTWIVGVVGDDDLGRSTRDDLEARGVDLSQLHIGSKHTGVAAILADEEGENLIAVASGANDELAATTVRASIEAISGQAADAVVLANLEIPEDAVDAAADAARDRGWPFLLNPAPARRLPKRVIERCAVLTPNEHEAELLAPGGVPGLLERGAGAVVVTRGAAGADVYRARMPVHHQDAFPCDPVDTTGAGDAFSAALAWSLSNGRSLEESVRVAAAAGALATRAVGARASLPTPDELEELTSPAT